MSAVDPAEAEEFTYTLQCGRHPSWLALISRTTTKGARWLLTSSSRERPLTSQSGESAIGYAP